MPPSAMRKLIGIATPVLLASLLLSTSPDAQARSGGSGGGGNKTTTTGPIGNTGFNPNPIVASQPVNLFVAFTFANGLTPEGGLDLTLRSADAAVAVPPTYHVPGGVFSVEIPVTTTAISNQRSVSVVVSSGGQSKVVTAMMFPLHATFAPVQLKSPGNGAGLGYHIMTKFEWAAQFNAYGYELQIASNAAFDPADVMDIIVPKPIWGGDYFNGTGTRYWRVRAVDASGTPGPWSSTWKFTVKPQ